jgi:hypothetical protein
VLRDPAVRVPIKCAGRTISASCGDDLTLADAQKAYSAVAPGDVLESRVDRHVCNEAETVGWFYQWAPSERIVDGTAALARLIAHTRDGRSFNDAYVAVDSDLSTADEQHLGLCVVTRVGNVAGPPRNCVTVAILTRTGTWLRTGNPRHGVWCPAAESFRASGAIDIEFDVFTKLGPSPFSTSVLNVLQSDLKLSAEQEVSMKDGVAHSIYIRSAAPLRNSEILVGGWREALDFTLSLRAEDGKVRIDGAAHTLVSRQALGSLTHYQGMDDAQKTLYARFLDSKVNSAIQAACRNYVQRDAKTISCD